MNAIKSSCSPAIRHFRWALTLLLLLPLHLCAAREETFALLRIGTAVYTNATVTTKAKTYIFIIHAGGMTNVRVADLPQDIREKLGYAVSEKAKSGTNSPAAWAKAEFAKLEVPSFKEASKRLSLGSQGRQSTGSLVAALLKNKLVLAVLGALALVYLFHSYCFMLICRKTGQEPSILVWIPLLQLIPLVRAAGMPSWWVLAFLVPVLNLVAQVLWSFNIAKARGKSIWTGVCLLLPITNFFAFLYLAFSDGAKEVEKEREPEVMSLQTA
jgi:hypothetical protein